jgi:hypothetical protein
MKYNDVEIYMSRFIRVFRCDAGFYSGFVSLIIWMDEAREVVNA